MSDIATPTRVDRAALVRQAFLELVAERGFHGASMSSVAQRAGVAYLSTVPWVDADRIALWGWSCGGASTLYSVLNSPGTWAAAVAGAPVTEWYLYDTIWTERYLDHPEHKPDGYEDDQEWQQNLAHGENSPWSKGGTESPLDVMARIMP